MTENEAIKVLKDFDAQVTAKADGAYQTNIGKMACDAAIKALEEVQQYRQIGSVELFAETKKLSDLTKKCGTEFPKIYECEMYMDQDGGIRTGKDERTKAITDWNRRANDADRD